MSSHWRKNISRRAILRGVGVSLSLPLLDAMFPRFVFAEDALHERRRFIAINIPLGFYGPNFFPQRDGRDYELSPYLKPAEDLRESFTVVSGTSHPEVDGGHSAEKSFLTAAPHPTSRNFKNTISLDQVIAASVGQQTRIASLCLGEQSMSWSANGLSIPAENSPSKTFERLFLVGTKQEVAAQHNRLHDGRSILDTVLEDAKSLERNISLADKTKLDQYFDAVRESEKRITKAELWSKTPKPVVDAEQPEAIDSSDFIRRFAAHLDVVKLALQTDSTRVVTLAGNNGSPVPPLKGVSEGYHGLSHHGQNPNMIKQLEIIDRATISTWLDFLRSLKSTNEGDSNLLDQTQILFGSNLGNASSHDTKNLPIILAGGGHRHGAHLAFAPAMNQPLATLFVTIMQRIGLETDRFASATGTLSI